MKAADLRTNVAAGWASAVVSAAVGLAVVPFQLHFLGVEGYGLIGFGVTVQSVLLLLDMGMTATVNRELARSVDPVALGRARGLLGAMECICWGLAVLSAATIAFLSPAIAQGWLNLVHLPVEDVVQALEIVGVLVGLRWPVALYQSALLGMQRMVVNSLINTGAVIASAGAGLAVLAWVASDIRLFLASQLIILVIQLLVLRGTASGVLALPSRWPARFGELSRIWQFSALSGLVTATGVCFMQMDKLLLSKMVPLDALGQYALATLVASGLYVITMPVFNALYPRFSALVASGKPGELESLYRLGSNVLAALLAPAGLVVALFSQPLLHAWTGDVQLSSEVAPLASLLALGSMLHGLMFVPFALTMAHGDAMLALKINLSLLATVAPLIVAGTLTWGPAGAAGALLLLQATYLVAGSYATHRVFLPRLRLNWLLRDVGPPLAGAAMTAWLVQRVGVILDAGSAIATALACLAWLLASAAALGSTPILRAQVIDHWRRMRRRSPLA